MILYTGNAVQDPTKTNYPNRIEVTDEESLRRAVAHDYVSAQYKDNIRSNSNFVVSDCLVMDCDNDHSDDPQDWKTTDDINATFPDVTYGIQYSRNHMREKNGKIPRPKFHVAFPINPVHRADEYAEMKRQVQKMFPTFDPNALDAGRCFFGTPEPQVEWNAGSRNLSEFLAEYEEWTTVSEACSQTVISEACSQTVIPEGQRNVTLSTNAAKLLKKYGDTDKAYQLFGEEAQKCVPLLDGAELETIWSSAKRFFHNTIEKQVGYVPPKVQKETKKCDGSLKYKPTDYSDVGQAQVLAELYRDSVCYSKQTSFLCYTGTHWEENDIKAQAMVHELTEVQLQEAEQAWSAAMEQLVATGAKTVLDVAAESKAVMTMNKAQKEAFQAYKDAKAYRDYAVRRRNSAQIKATMTELHPMVAIDPALLDANPYLMCTPEATYDLRLGLDGARPHMPEDYITKITAASPGTEGAAIWQRQLETVFCGDTELIEYVQQICGTVLVGQVRIESIVIAYGSGRNGKSTFWNVIARVLGKYSGTISAEVLTTSCKHNARPELAELRGKRLAIAAEMREGAMMNDSMLKQLSSTDEITAEKKYRDPFAFVPSHTLVLYTKHLPKVCADDYGTWRRLLVIPFEAVIEGSGDIKNYAEYLYEKAAPAIMSWLIEGARKAYEASYRLPVPSRVQAAMDEYREANDWFGHFLADCCDVAPHLRVGSGALYTAYREYCKATYDYTRSTKDFYAVLNNKGYKSTKSKGLTYYHGLAIKPITEYENCAGVGVSEGQY